jgi:hypothetical protein
MGMKRYYNRFWIGFTFILSVVFILLFFPMALERYNLSVSILLTTAGVLVIWMVYLVRAIIFTRLSGKGKTG